jgi:hypothetical protein
MLRAHRLRASKWLLVSYMCHTCCSTRMPVVQYMNTNAAAHCHFFTGTVAVLYYVRVRLVPCLVVLSVVGVLATPSIPQL